MKKRILIILAFGVLVLSAGLVILWWIGGKSLENNTSDVEANRAQLVQATNELLGSRPGTSTEILRQAIEKKGDLPVIIPDLRQVKPAGVYYELVDLRLADITEPSALREYGLQVAAAMSLYAKAEIHNEMAEALAAYQANQPLQLTGVTKMKNLYLQIIERLAIQTVPQSAGPAHLALINSLVGLAEIDIHMEQIFDEPVVGLQAIQLYPERYGALLKAMLGINKYFTDQGIKFSATEHTDLPYIFAQ
ncbi:MAG: hypothetical protein HYT48_00430 [Candidatus Vogelbacteria bacterium]|nr:hypothetical protein [Candidatus Vogelbacteria bacterium]